LPPVSKCRIDVDTELPGVAPPILRNGDVEPEYEYSSTRGSPLSILSLASLPVPDGVSNKKFEPSIVNQFVTSKPANVGESVVPRPSKVLASVADNSSADPFNPVEFPIRVFAATCLIPLLKIA
jgi:hypothetical protein